MTRLLAGTGSSSLPLARAAGQEAAQAALAALHGEAPALVVTYVSVRYDLPEAIAGIRSITGDAPLVGSTSSGHFHDGELQFPGEGIVVLAMTAGPYRFGVASVSGLAQDSDGAGRTLALAARNACGESRGQYAAVLLLADGLAGDHQQLLNGIHRVTGSTVPVVGGAAGDDRQLRSTSVIHNDRVLHDAAVAVWIAADRPLRVAHGHGWEPVTEPLLVTHSEGVVVEQLGGRPGLEVFSEAVAAAHDGSSPAPLTGRWHTVHALGLIEPDGTLAIRSPRLDGDGLLRTLVPLPPYAAVQIVSSDPDSLLDVVEDVVTDTAETAEPGVLLAFSCVARLDLLGDRAADEAKRLQAAAGQVPTIGFYTYGEFARTVGVSGIHNATLVAIAL